MSVCYIEGILEDPAIFCRSPTFRPSFLLCNSVVTKTTSSSPDSISTCAPPADMHADSERAVEEYVDNMTCLQLAVEYLDFCIKYPSRGELKYMRGHLMKILYRYYILDSSVRDMLCTAKSWQDFRSVCEVRDAALELSLRI